MARKENTALRLHRILGAMVAQPHNIPTQVVLLRALHIDPATLGGRSQTVMAARILLFSPNPVATSRIHSLPAVKLNHLQRMSDDTGMLQSCHIRRSES